MSTGKRGDVIGPTLKRVALLRKIAVSVIDATDAADAMADDALSGIHREAKARENWCARCAGGPALHEPPDQKTLGPRFSLFNARRTEPRIKDRSRERQPLHSRRRPASASLSTSTRRRPPSAGPFTPGDGRRAPASRPRERPIGPLGRPINHPRTRNRHRQPAALAGW